MSQNELRIIRKQSFQTFGGRVMSKIIYETLWCGYCHKYVKPIDTKSPVLGRCPLCKRVIEAEHQ